MTHATRLALTVVLFGILLAIGITFNYLTIRYQLAHSQVQWCDTLRLLTSHPVAKPANPSANPSRLASYQLYQDFLSLKQKFGC